MLDSTVNANMKRVDWDCVLNKSDKNKAYQMFVFVHI